MNACVRRSAASATPALRQTLAALVAAEPLRFHLASGAAPPSTSEETVPFRCGRPVERNLGNGMCRGVHFSAAPLWFRASAVAGAECALDDAPFGDDERSNSDESLETSKLGIAPEIATVLANRGITKLFPIQVGDSDQKLAEGITLYSIASDNYGKPSIIGPLITDHAKGGKCIVFTQTKRDADRLAYCMSRSYKCEALHGDISQSQRERTLAGFRDGRFNILVATDVAARGLDIPNVDLVIHYELPTTSEIFVHRSGRTGRAGKRGSAILIYTEQQTRAVRQIENDIGCRFNELPRIKAASEMDGFFVGMRGGPSRSIGGGRMSSPGSSHSGGFGRSGFGRSSSLGGGALGHSGDFSYARMGEYGGSGLGCFRSFGPGGSGLSDGFRNSGQRSGFGQSGSGFGDGRSGGTSGLGVSGTGSGGPGPGITGGVFGNSSPGTFGRSDGSGSGRSAFSSGLGSNHLSGRGDSRSSSSSGFGDSASGQP